jgi:hypothetical protein
MAVMDEIAEDKVLSGQVRVLTGVASDAVARVINLLHERHEHESAEAVRTCWNLFIKVVQPLWMDGPCTNPDHGEGTDVGPVGTESDTRSARQGQESPD